LAWPGRRWPSEATLRRALRHVDVAALHARLEQVVGPAPAPVAGGGLVGQAIDGKTLRGARSHGQAVHLVGLVRHDGAVLAQMAVDDKASELVAAAHLMAGRDLTGTVLTMDALFTQRTFAAQIRAQGGHYLMVVKDNQPELAAAIATLFADPPWLVGERAAEYAVHRTVDKGHGRLEARHLEASPSLNAWLDWPDVGQVLRRTCRRVNLRTGAIQEAVMLGLTSVPFHPRRVGQVERHWRDHWSIENRVHYVRDETLREDRGQAFTGSTAPALAALRNAVLNRLRQHGWTNIADAVRHYAAAPLEALALVGVAVHGL
jgi:predicted transposase YbfD/YdcC